MGRAIREVVVVGGDWVAGAQGCGAYLLTIKRQCPQIQVHGAHVDAMAWHVMYKTDETSINRV